MVAMGRVQQFAREGQPLPPDAAVDADGKPTTPFMRFGDTIRIEMLDDNDENIFGTKSH